MEYSLPHAVMAFLQEEDSPNLPKSYFISSSTKSTKITLIYTRRKTNSFKTAKRKSIPDNSVLNGNIKRHRRRYSSSSTDDYTKGSHKTKQCGYGSCDHNKLNRRMCASTPGRGYNGGVRAREVPRSTGTVKMATDPMVGNSNSPSKEHLPLSYFLSNIGDNEESTGDDNFGILSPSSPLSDRPPTPGRDLNSSNSPRPPTPNASNYASLMSSTKCDVLPSVNIRSHHAHPRQPAIEHYDNNISRPITPCARRSNNSNSNQSRKGVSQEAPKQQEGLRDSDQQITAANYFLNLPPITIRSPSPEVLHTKTNPLFFRDKVKR